MAEDWVTSWGTASLCLIVESVIGEIRSGCIERVVLLAIVWIKCLGECPFYSWMNVLSMNHIISSTVGRSVVKACLVGRSSVVVVQIKANANKHRTHADTSDALSKMRGSERSHDDGDEWNGRELHGWWLSDVCLVDETKLWFQRVIAQKVASQAMIWLLIWARNNDRFCKGVASLILSIFIGRD